LEGDFCQGHYYWANLSGIKDLSGVDNFPELKELPNPFQMNDGSRVKSPADWAQWRKEIKAVTQYFQYGYIPPPPGNVKAEQFSSEMVYNSQVVTTKRFLCFHSTYNFGNSKPLRYVLVK
jgi:hypothetical protein